MTYKQTFAKLAMLILLINTSIIGQNTYKYPVDSLVQSPKTNIIQKAVLLPISFWQRYSYNNDELNCQFYPSCSNYSALAVSKYSVIQGLIMTSDRLVRCNSSAYRNHIHAGMRFKVSDGRLIDPLTLPASANSSRTMLPAMLLSSIIPGSGRVYLGRTHDGLIGFSFFSISLGFAYLSHQNDWPALSLFFSGLCVNVYLGELYGTYRTAKYY